MRNKLSFIKLHCLLSTQLELLVNHQISHQVQCVTHVSEVPGPGEEGKEGPLVVPLGQNLLTVPKQTATLSSCKTGYSVSKKTLVSISLSLSSVGL